MATTTENLELTLPAKSEIFDLEVFNTNFTKIDNAIGSINESITNINAAIEDIIGEG